MGRKRESDFTRERISNEKPKAQRRNSIHVRLSIGEESALCRRLLCRWLPAAGRGVGGRKWFFVLIPLGPRVVESQEDKYMPARLARFCPDVPVCDRRVHGPRIFLRVYACRVCESTARERSPLWRRRRLPLHLA